MLKEGTFITNSCIPIFNLQRPQFAVVHWHTNPAMSTRRPGLQEGLSGMQARNKQRKCVIWISALLAICVIDTRSILSAQSSKAEDQKLDSSARKFRENTTTLTVIYSERVKELRAREDEIEKKLKAANDALTQLKN